MVTAVFPAAGMGKRMKAGKNKVFLEIGGEPILFHTLRKFSSVGRITELIIAVAPAEVDMVREMLKNVAGLKPYKVVAGGSERQYSIANALAEVSAMSEIVLVHDAARPLVSAKTIDAVIDGAKEFGGAIAAVPAKNTIKVADNDIFVESTPDRSTLWEVQTPQGFRRDILLAAYEQAAKDNFLGTDDSSLVERYGQKVKLITSDYRNIKITTPEDLTLAEALLRE